MEQRHAHLQAEACDHGGGLRGAEVQVEEHPGRAAALHDLQHAEQGILLRDDGLPGVLAQRGEERGEARVLEILGDDHIAKAKPATRETGPFPIPLMHAEEDGAALFADEFFFHEVEALGAQPLAPRLRIEPLGPEKIEHGAGEVLIRSPRDLARCAAV